MKKTKIIIDMFDGKYEVVKRAGNIEVLDFIGFPTKIDPNDELLQNIEKGQLIDKFV